MAWCLMAPSHYLSHCSPISWLCCRTLSLWGNELTRHGITKVVTDLLITFFNAVTWMKLYSESNMAEVCFCGSDWQNLPLVQIIPGNKEVTSHYLKQCWPWYMASLISMAQCKTAVFPVLMHWRYHSLALNRWYGIASSQCVKPQSWVITQQKSGSTDRLSLFVYAKLWEKSV